MIDFKFTIMKTVSLIPYKIYILNQFIPYFKQGKGIKGRILVLLKICILYHFFYKSPHRKIELLNVKNSRIYRKTGRQLNLKRDSTLSNKPNLFLFMQQLFFPLHFQNIRKFILSYINILRKSCD